MNIRRLVGTVFTISFIALNASHGALHTVKDSLTGEVRSLAIKGELWNDYDLLKTILVSTLHGDADVGDYQIMWRGEPITAENHAIAWSHEEALDAPIIVVPLVFATNEGAGGSADGVELVFNVRPWSRRAVHVTLNRDETAVSILERAVERAKVERILPSDFPVRDCTFSIVRSRIREGEELTVRLLPGNEAAFLSAAAEGGFASLHCISRGARTLADAGHGGGGGGSSEVEND